MLELRHLQVLRAIAREGSLAAAARSLHHAQPTVTHHLATLEAHLGTRLVHRGPRGTTLTEAGELLLPHAEAVLRRIGQAEREVRDLVRSGEATLRVGTFPTAGAGLLPPAVRRLLGSGVRLGLTEGELPALLDGLRSRELHVALVFHQPGERLDLDHEVTVHPLLDDPLMLVLPADHPQAALDRVPLAALREEGWIMGTTDWDPVDRALLRVCAAEGFEPVPVLRTDDYGVLQGFVAAGIGVALVPRLGLGTTREDVVVRPLAGHTPTRRIGVALLPGRAPAPAEALLAELRTEAARLHHDWSSP
ncbi:MULTISPECIES: LysR family transcriptional regulator [Kitasatospora]|uniref:DNA-binding transcriptional LysR family regulator n=2 Tax=Kitasatospora TaxID=2063 RepID=A0ABT1IT53_9ACTN|nr:LysR family transcriptional regulator [Kitasatospora paracochleata]MCP2308310.1 DNA-binding transcriptional LysR family regulator [Kitasatospora paracochleata]